MTNLINRSAIALLCGVFVLGGFSSDADAKRKRRKSRVVKKAEAAQKKAEKERALAEAERNKAESERVAAEAAAAESKRHADEAKSELKKLRAASASAAGGSAAAPAAGPSPVVAANLGGSAGSRPLWGGFFMSFNLGYSTSGGAAGQAIPNPGNGYRTNLTPGLLRLGDFERYSEAVTTDVGAGFAIDFQIGYNIAGYVSLWADISGHGSCCAKSDQAGAVAGALMLGVHPLRFWRPDAPADIKLYVGYGIFELLGYHETVFQTKATGKAWFGSMIPFGLSTEYRIPNSVFAMGVDLRFVSATYDRWIYNYDEDMKSDLGSAGFPNATTFRFEPRLVFGWHF